jgi:hypothetical protein
MIKIFATAEILSLTRIGPVTILAHSQQKRVKLAIINVEMVTELRVYMFVNLTLLKDTQLSTKSIMAANVFVNVTPRLKVR